MQEPIRVLQVVTKMDRGGLETWLMNVYRHLDREKVQLDFLCHRLEPGDYDDEIMALGGNIYRLSPLSFKNFFGYFKSLDTFFKEHRQYTIVHSQLSAMSTPIVRAAFQNNVSVRISHSRTAGAKRDLKLPIRVFFKLFLKKYTTHAFACSKSGGIWLFGKRYMEKGRVKIWNNAINADCFSYDVARRSELRKELGLGNQLVVGHVGRFAYPKNHNFLIDVFEKIAQKEPNAVLLLVGDGELRQGIEEKCAQKGLTENVLFVGKTTDVASYLQVADVFLFPSHYEGLPNSVIEAQAAALPCILSDTIDEGVKITNLVQMLSLNQSAESWADVVLNTLKLGLERKDMQEEIQSQGYDVKILTKELQDFYTGFSKRGA